MIEAPILEDHSKSLKKINDSYDIATKNLNVVLHKCKETFTLKDSERSRFNDIYIQAQKEVLFGLNTIMEHVSTSSLKLQVCLSAQTQQLKKLEYDAMMVRNQFACEVNKISELSPARQLYYSKKRSRICDYSLHATQFDDTLQQISFNIYDSYGAMPKLQQQSPYQPKFLAPSPATITIPTDKPPSSILGGAKRKLSFLTPKKKNADGQAAHLINLSIISQSMPRLNIGKTSNIATRINNIIADSLLQSPTHASVPPPPPIPPLSPTGSTMCIPVAIQSPTNRLTECQTPDDDTSSNASNRPISVSSPPTPMLPTLQSEIQNALKNSPLKKAGLFEIGIANKHATELSPVIAEAETPPLKPTSFLDQLKLKQQEKKKKRVSHRLSGGIITLKPGPSLIEEVKLRKTQTVKRPVATVNQSNVCATENVSSIRQKWRQIELDNPIPPPFSDRRLRTQAVEMDDILNSYADVVTGSEGNLSESKQQLDTTGSSSQSFDLVDAIPVEALADYSATDGGQLSLRKGELLFVFDWDYGNGWSFGENADGVAGVFPRTYCRAIEDTENPLLKEYE